MQPGNESKDSTKVLELSKFSCILCNHRKVKCDRLSPCSNCQKAHSECIYRVPPPPRRRKRKIGDGSLDVGSKDEVPPEEKLQIYETALRGLGVNIERLLRGEGTGPEIKELGAFLPKSTTKESRPERLPGNDCRPSAGSEDNPSEMGKLIVGMDNLGRSTYFENHLWRDLSDEMKSPKDLALNDWEEDKEHQDDDGHHSAADNRLDSLLFGVSPLLADLRDLHPHVDQILKHWKVFKESINPILKVIHIPTTEAKVIELAPKLARREEVPLSFEVLLFAIYCSSIFASSPQACQARFGDSYSILLVKYQGALNLSLQKAKFLSTSDMTVLTALFIFLSSAKNHYDPQSIWTLSGTCLRIGQRLGLQRDGYHLGLSPFEVEMRRRLWWQIWMFDGSLEEMVGSGSPLLDRLSDTQFPCNINDADIWPGMTTPPTERTGPTEMIFCRLRWHIGRFFRHAPRGKGFDGRWELLSGNQFTLAEKDAAIDELEQYVERQFVRYLDPLEPLHVLCSIASRAILTTLRFVAHHPRQYVNDAEVPQAERDLLYELSLKSLEYVIISFQTPAIERFDWHFRFQFPWRPFIYLLHELTKRLDGDDVEQAWRKIDELFRGRSDMLLQSNNLLHAAAGNLALKAWAAREKKSVEEGKKRGGMGEPLRTPQFVTTLKALREKRDGRSRNGNDSWRQDVDEQLTDGVTMMEEPLNELHGLVDMSSFEFDFSLQDSGFNWMEWDEMLSGNRAFHPGGQQEDRRPQSFDEAMGQAG
ncbi:hypothetical protein P152DRAFT_455041 [Eremomyces bilateralis CBS 781.70]|uniref:Zn(2)-C6 fungal-type domain-containing protein n=1 Tax=Eremomyces bilateralis CBS 781.70 TaxID=1392243 RepID=A0A6G1GB76_9PEZI|nr:uncharacterized protein P152DRAFT_455041 [Eremomyces bilateralis CBS 781.70]KAF1815325.1 hypothetical protein P152DRAFT_455041 [Eremomyces bilateralis CBS 781.70]